MSSSQNARSKRSKRAAALEEQQALDLLRIMPRLELQQLCGDEAAQHEAAKTKVRKLQCQNDDLNARLDEAEMAVARAEERARTVERENARLEESMSKMAVAEERNEGFMSLLAETNQKLKEANRRITTQAASREKDLTLEVEMMDLQTRRLEDSLTVGFRDVETYAALFQKNCDDWARFVEFLEQRQHEENERFPDLLDLTAEVTSTIAGLRTGFNELLRVSETSIAARREKEAIEDEMSGWQSSDQSETHAPRSLSQRRRLSADTVESIHRYVPDTDDEETLIQAQFGSKRNRPHSTAPERSVSAHDSLLSLAPLVQGRGNGFALFQLHASDGDLESTLYSGFPDTSSIRKPGEDDSLDESDWSRLPALDAVGDRPSDYHDVEMDVNFVPSLRMSRKRARFTVWSEVRVTDEKGAGPELVADDDQGEAPGPISDPDTSSSHTETKAVQTEIELSDIHWTGLDDSLLRPVDTAPKPRGRPRSLSVGDLPRSWGQIKHTTPKHVAGVWPGEVTPHEPGGNPICFERIKDVASTVFTAFRNTMLPIFLGALNLLDPANPHCIAYPLLLLWWLWRGFQHELELNRWESANEAYFSQRLRNQYAYQTGWMDSIGFEISQWFEFDRSSFG
ncbi:Uncharacterized protein PECH_003854 [Penicillium ucsense]|uniref:Uncharacterized protein n=1 Tax=Penicillium ucsense TaxID=2839758 RepID=A0A8J8W603_9EURO|nr:Uncharacterized protein PECM_005621 [Penicillium ucsense]KAF7737402.1 Uncharacterized protein PECH_003854 [Penicillium ucsense]